LETPFVSILIPIRNEAACIEECLEAVLAQDYPHDRFEILVADGMSNDGTREKLFQIQKLHPQLHVFTNHREIVPTGLNKLIRQALGEILIRVDGHTIIHPDYIRNCVELLQSSGADNVGGRMNAQGNDFLSHVVAAATSSPFGVGGAKFHYSNQEAWVDTVYMGAWKRETFRKWGLFDEELVRDQDDEFNYRLLKFGGKILLSPKIKSIYTPRGSIKKLWQQYFQYGLYKVRVLQKHPLQMSYRQFIPPLFVLALLANLVIALILPRGWISLLGLAGGYLIVNLLVSLFISARIDWQYLFFFPPTFATLHISYGCGFLVGLFKFWNRWQDKQGHVPEVDFE